MPAWQSSTATIAIARIPSMSGRKPVLVLSVGLFLTELIWNSGDVRALLAPDRALSLGFGDFREPGQCPFQDFRLRALGVVAAQNLPEEHAAELACVSLALGDWHNLVVDPVNEEQRLFGRAGQRREPAPGIEVELHPVVVERPVVFDRPFPAEQVRDRRLGGGAADQA